MVDLQRPSDDGPAVRVAAEARVRLEAFEVYFDHMFVDRAPSFCLGSGRGREDGFWDIISMLVEVRFRLISGCHLDVHLLHDIFVCGVETEGYGTLGKRPACFGYRQVGARNKVHGRCFYKHRTCLFAHTGLTEKMN